MPIDHWMTFGTFAEQRYFVYPSATTYKGVIINGNMAAYAPDGLAAFLLEKTPGLPYIVDPITHGFQHDPSAVLDREQRVRSSIQTLADAYGGPITAVVGRRPVMPRDFANDKELHAFVRRCLDFQRAQVATAMQDSEASKYIEEGQAATPPYALIPPYFFLTESTIERWLPVCKRSAEMALAEKQPGERIFCAVVVSQGILLNDNAIDRIAHELAQRGVTGFLVWVDDLDEHEAEGGKLAGLCHLARSLKGNADREVVNLHGGYFSVLAAGKLGRQAFSGVAHGPEFGESRAVVPVGGGIPIARYYLPCLHQRVRYRDSLRILREKGWLRNAGAFYRNVCDCEECTKLIGSDTRNFTSFGIGNPKVVRRGRGMVRIEYPTSETKEHCLRHYLQRKAIEYGFADSASEAKILQDLQDGIDELGEVVGLEGVAHLENWRGALST